MIDLLTQTKRFYFPATFLIIVLFTNVNQCWNPFQDMQFGIFPNLFPQHPEQRGHGNSQTGKVVPPLFIAHRGAKFLMPESTIPAFDLATIFKVNFVETDLVVTKDHVLVCHHDITLKRTTDVSSRSEFADLMYKNTTVFMNGTNVTILDDWLISDFTWEQLATLRVTQEQIGWRPHHFDGYFGIPSFQQYIEAVHKDTWRRKSLAKNKTGHFVVGLIPELKYPDYHNSEVYGSEHSMETEFLAALKENGYPDGNCSYKGEEIPCSPLIVQCFHIETIKYLHDTADLVLWTLLEVDLDSLRYFTYDGLKELQRITAYVCVEKDMLYSGVEHVVSSRNISYDKEEMTRLGGFVESKDFIPYAHDLGLKVGVHSLFHSAEESTRTCEGKCEPEMAKEKELEYYMDMGVDACFVEGLTESLRIRDRWEKTRNAENSEKTRTWGSNFMKGCPVEQQKTVPCLH